MHTFNTSNAQRIKKFTHHSCINLIQLVFFPAEIRHLEVNFHFTLNSLGLRNKSVWRLAPFEERQAACNREGGLRAYPEQCEGSRPQRSTGSANKEVMGGMCGLLSSQTIPTFLNCISLYPIDMKSKATIVTGCGLLLTCQKLSFHSAIT